jgi:hypothetical protein
MKIKILALVALFTLAIVSGCKDETTDGGAGGAGGTGTGGVVDAGGEGGSLAGAGGAE